MFYIRDFLGVFEHEREREYRYIAKKRPFDVLCYRAEGESHFRSGNKEYISKKGSIVFIPKNTEYAQSGQGMERLIAVHFVADRRVSEEIRVFDAEEAHVLAPLLQSMLSGYKNSGYMPTEALLSSLYAVFFGLFHMRASAPTPWEKALAVFEAHYLDTDFSVLEWATALGASRTYLQTLCKHEIKQTPCAYLQSRRLEYAASLLISGAQKIKNIAFMCGYYSEKNFLRAFSSHFGVSCTAYRKMYALGARKI